MANWTKQLGTAAGACLQPGEEVRAAVFLQPAGTTTRMMARAWVAWSAPRSRRA